MSICFVIQPFDDGRFDKRFEDVFGPAIIDAGLEPYRVDRDPKVTIPIEEIENGIRQSTLCLAEITLDNPNVWFELGFAIASRKDVILICSSERERRFPFDVQHRSIITYSVESKSDFDRLKESITQRIRAIITKKENLQRVGEPKLLTNIEGLSQHELFSFAAIAENLFTPSDNVSAYTLRQEVEKGGFTRTASMLAIRTLMEKGFIDEGRFEEGYNSGELYTGYTITDLGWEWIVGNQDKFVIKTMTNSEPDDGA